MRGLLVGTDNLRFLSEALFGHSRPLWQQCLLAFPVALVPSLALVASAYALVAALGLSTAVLKAPNLEPTWWELVGTVLFAPLVETFLLAGVLRLLSMVSANTPFIAAVSGLLWGALHGTRAALWFFGTAWSFFVFSCPTLRGVECHSSTPMWPHSFHTCSSTSQ